MVVVVKASRAIFLIAASLAVASSNRPKAAVGPALIQARVQGSFDGTAQRLDNVSLMDQTSTGSFPIPTLPSGMLGPNGVAYWRNRGWMQGAMACVATGTEVEHALPSQEPPCRNPIKAAHSRNFARYVRTIEDWEFPEGGAAWRNHAFQIGYNEAKEACWKIALDVPYHSRRCIERFFCNAYRKKSGRRSFKERFSAQYKSSFINRYAKDSVCSSAKKHCDC